jgi:diketogulonate reductase-like aldo/keto reductase
MNWHRQEGYVPASKSRTQARIEKNNLELQMND